MKTSRKNEFFKLKILLLLLLVVSFSSCVSRLARPAISGVIVDYDKKPVADCRVGETTTDKNGKFYLTEKRYNKFLLSEMMVMEAPPIWVMEPITKEGFKSDAITFSNPRGGGQAKGAKYQIDTIFLKKVNQQFDVERLLADKTWNLSYTKNADTIYMVSPKFNEWCKTENCHAFYNSYEVLTDNYYHSNSKNLTGGVIKRFIEVRFNADHSGQLQQVQHYMHTYEGPNKPIDTLKTNINWTFKKPELIRFVIPQRAEISHPYKIAMLDLYHMMLIKSKE
ncbi:hypothetical protein H9X96_20320 [Pedobacter sp. N36a]|uniref:hypothetical protein n=1 Tax=Pedobacter sp. N36a TaxID=2767996 RepID=UPI0016572E99|nr:hypothetical protein [Pedobacter sp. N36a]MBC8988106.1 hypothetical protein [Pedobacter sp. N36a]